MAIRDGNSRNPTTTTTARRACLLVVAVLAVGGCGTSDPQDVVAGGSQSDSTVLVAPEPARGAEPSTTQLPPMVEDENHPQSDFYENDPEGEQLAEALQNERVTGWSAYQLTPALIGWIPTEFTVSAFNGDVSEVADQEGLAIGYYIIGVGYVPTADFESDTFDWQAHARSVLDPKLLDEVIDSIQTSGGLSEDIYRIDPNLPPPPALDPAG